MYVILLCGSLLVKSKLDLSPLSVLKGSFITFQGESELNGIKPVHKLVNQSSVTYFDSMGRLKD